MRKPGAVVVFITLFAIFLALLFPRLSKVAELQSRSSRLDTELRQIKKQNTALETELKLLQSDPVYLEKVAREKFNKAKSGEIVYKVIRE